PWLSGRRLRKLVRHHGHQQLAGPFHRLCRDGCAGLANTDAWLGPIVSKRPRRDSDDLSRRLARTVPNTHNTCQEAGCTPGWPGARRPIPLKVGSLSAFFSLPTGVDLALRPQTGPNHTILDDPIMRLACKIPVAYRRRE